jgi:hypothetical protein
MCRSTITSKESLCHYGVCYLLGDLMLEFPEKVRDNIYTSKITSLPKSKLKIS